MKPYKAEHTKGDIFEAKLFNHGEMSMKIRKKHLKKTTKKFLKMIDKSNKD